jgi:hypothetical protein
LLQVFVVYGSTMLVEKVGKSLLDLVEPIENMG